MSINSGLLIHVHAPMNLLRTLLETTGLPLDKIEQGLILRANKIYADTHFIADWVDDESLIPDWANRAAASWVIELWMLERDAVESSQLLKVDEKYTRMLKDFSLSDIIAMRNELMGVETS